MRPAASLVSILAPSGRLAIAALLIAAALALMTHAASAHHTPGTAYNSHCRSYNDPAAGSLVPELAGSEEFVKDCIALLKAAEGLTEGEDTAINWLFGEDPRLDILAPISMNESTWDGVWIEEVGAAPSRGHRITRVDLGDKDLGGRLAPEWADLTALTALDLSNNHLSGAAPYDAWAFLDALETLNLDGNKDLRPSPPLNLVAEVSRTADGEPQAALSFHSVWYTLEVARHEYRYSADGGANWGPNAAEGSDGWTPVASGCINSGAPVLCSKNDGATPPARNRVVIGPVTLPKSNAYVFQARAVKETPYTDDKGTPNDASDDTQETQVTRSRVSQVDVVGAQVLTAESDFLLELGAAYRVASPLPDASILVVNSAVGGLHFFPSAATGGNDVIVNLAQAASDVTASAGEVIGRAGGAISFPVEIKPASTAPTKTDIPNQSISTAEHPARLALADYFQGEGLTYAAASSRYSVAIATIDEGTGELVITALQNGVTIITVTATNPDRGKAAATFRATVWTPNEPPTAVTAAPDQTIYLDETGARLDMTEYFYDPDNDPLRLSPQSSNPMVVTATSDGSSVVFNPVSVGEAKMTVVAEDPEGERAFLTFTVTVLPPNQAPQAVGAIPAYTLRLGDPGLTLEPAPYFTDANGDPLTFAAESADESIATATAAEGAVTITPVAVGETRVTITATDPKGESAAQVVAVAVLPANSPPQAVGSMDDQALVVGGSLLTIDVAGYFIDPDGDALAFAATSSNEDALQAGIIGDSSSLALKPLAPAEGAAVTVTATDPDGESVEQTFTATVLARMSPAPPTAAPAPAATPTPTPTQTPEPTASPTPAPTAAPEPTPTETETPPAEEGGGPPLGLILILLLAIVAVAVLIINRRRGSSEG